MSERLAARSHDETLSQAFDAQAAQFEKAPVQTNPEALARLVKTAAFPDNALVLDAGCGPGLVAAELIKAGCRVHGVDLSAEMIARARTRCPSGRFEVGSVLDHGVTEAAPFDGVISRFVLHHVPSPRVFVARQVELLKRGGIVVLCDHTTGTDPNSRYWHQEIERDRDQSHTNCLTPGEIVDLFASCGLSDISMVEHSYTLDFDEWFDRGTPRQPKSIVRAKILDGSWCRGFDPNERPDGGITLKLWMTIARGIKAY